MQDAWRAYLELAMGLTEAPRKKAQDTVRRVVGSGGATATQLQSLAEELVSTGASNREALTKLVRFEVDRALGLVGLATAEEVAELNRRVRDLEGQLRQARLGGAAPATSATGARVGGPAVEPVAEGPQDARAPGAAVTGQAAVAKKAVARQPVAKKAVARQPATKAVAKKAVAKKAVVRRSPGDEPPATGGSADEATA
ncbi:hypothetical protein ABT336_25505 [Micromonospora sp. NPDC000207]|uniref:phasin family protein n=1 Tax=Micromonospora sp. NPDC000207 TaxID=3154246 RepID=UPI003334547B